jgi:hypothetical protein
LHESVPLQCGYFLENYVEALKGDCKKNTFYVQISQYKTHHFTIISTNNTDKVLFLSFQNLSLIYPESYAHRSYYGTPDYECQYCHAIFWYNEWVGGSHRERTIIYNNCCKGGKFVIPPYKPRPEPLVSLPRFDGSSTFRSFMHNIRQYNCLFAFTSMGANIDNSVNDGHGPLVFKISGQVHHRIGSLLPTDGTSPKYIQLYIYDTANEVKNRMKCLNNGETIAENLNPSIIQGLMKILDENNPFVKKFRMARDRLREGDSL